MKWRIKFTRMEWNMYFRLAKSMKRVDDMIRKIDYEFGFVAHASYLVLAMVGCNYALFVSYY